MSLQLVVIPISQRAHERFSGGLIFLAYVMGTASSAASGYCAERIGLPATLGIGTVTMLAGTLLTVPDHLAVMISGLLVCTAGFFFAHAVASG